MLSSQDFPPFIEKSFSVSSCRDKDPIVGGTKFIQKLPLVNSNDNCDADARVASTSETRVLNFAMLGCETKEPYGPLAHTAQLLIDLLGMAAVAVNTGTASRREAISNTKDEYSEYSYLVIRIHIYNVQEMEYPYNQWDNYDGFIIPGSFSAAYDTDPWIEQLKCVIQTEIVSRHRKTLGICFGHQIMAHSFEITPPTTTPTATTENIEVNYGRAVPTPSGPRAGRFQMPLTSAGWTLLSKPIQQANHGKVCNGGNDDSNRTVQLYFTHGDMVEQIPSVAVNLGGDTTVPIQSVAYFATSHDADRYSNIVDTDNDTALAMPYAITLQAHPEYSTSIEMGLNRTLFQCMSAMERRRPDGNVQSRDDAIHNFLTVQNDSIAMVARIGQILGWF